MSISSSNNQTSSSPSLLRGAGFMSNISVGRKLTILSITMIVGVTAIFLATIVGYRSLRLQILNAQDKALASILAINKADGALDEIKLHLEIIQDANTAPTMYLEQITNIHASEVLIITTIQSYETEWALSLNPDFTQILAKAGKTDLQVKEQAAISSLHDSYNKYLSLMDNYSVTVSSGHPDAQIAAQINEALLEMHGQFDLLNTVNADFITISNANYLTIHTGAVTSTVILWLVTIIATIVIARAVNRSIGGRLLIVEQASNDILDGLMDRRYTIDIDGKDEIASIANILKRAKHQLYTSFSSLGQRVTDREMELEKVSQYNARRAQQFESIAQVGRAINSAQSLPKLLPQIVSVIHQQFGYYHVGIFLNDSSNQYSILSAANSEGGQVMLKRGHQLKIGEQGIVGYVTGKGTPRIALDVGEDSVYFDNPDLPTTRSEMALPLKIGDVTIGALDVQSTEPNAFTGDDVDALSILADQVSLAIQNARSYDQTQKALAEAESIYRQFTQDTWNRQSQDQKLSGYRYTVAGAVPLGENTEAESATVELNRESSRNEISVPIILRGQTIGTLSVLVPKQEHIKPDQMDLIKAVAERVALSAENARLFQDTTDRAERERLVSDITTKIRSTNDPQEMIQIAMEELQNALGATRVEIVSGNHRQKTDQ